MLRSERLPLGCALAASVLFASAGCQQAGRYEVSSKKAETTRPADVPKKSAGPQPIPLEYAWMEPALTQMQPDTRIVFLHDSDPEWTKLKEFWTVEYRPFGVLPSFLPPLLTGGLAAATLERTAKIKLPAGLDDPNKSDYLPAANPPTLGKWMLGKQLFFDETYLWPGPERVSCAKCHTPSTGFSEKHWAALLAGMRPPALINSLYNRHQFWDGRATRLEEVVQRVLEDERETPDAPGSQRHTWSGVIKRLREHKEYPARFREVFGSLPTQDAVGKALATYLRTILAGNSIYDRAVRLASRVASAPGATVKALEVSHFEKALDKEIIEALNRSLDQTGIGAEKFDPGKPAAAAKELHAGYELFRGKARCTTCHAPPRFTDDGFHNLGIGDSAVNRDVIRRPPPPGKEPGRIATVPTGLKDASLIGAYKTPALRALPPTGPYFHDGSESSLFRVVVRHVKPDRGLSTYLDPQLRDDKGNPRDLGLTEKEIRSLVLFLLALDGDAIDPIVANPEKWPEGLSPPK